MRIVALIVAAGVGARAGVSGGRPKQYQTLGGRSVLARSIDVFASHPAIDAILVVIGSGQLTLYDQAIETCRAGVLPPVTGGASRQASVRSGLAALVPAAPTHVLIHDAARPFLDHGIIDRVVTALRTHPGAVAGLPLTDTLKRADADGMSAGTLDRAGLWRAQTPQGFDFDAIHAAHAAAHQADKDDFTDDAAVAEWAGIAVALVTGSARNLKLTTPEDFAMAEHMLRTDEHPRLPTEVRTGSGFDVHRFEAGNAVWLCGVEVPHVAKLEGHSDADVGLHALTDAILGAIGDGDIGQHFPPSDARWKDAASHIFLAHAAGRVTARGGRITNVDVTILAEAPRVSPYRPAMCARIAQILGIAASRVSVKATTTEGLGFTGRREGIAAMATATIMLPVD